MSVIKDFHKLKKYNVQELTVDQNQAVSTSGGASKEPVLESNLSPHDEVKK